jgi:hypothetical protein
VRLRGSKLLRFPCLYLMERGLREVGVRVWRVVRRVAGMRWARERVRVELIARLDRSEDWVFCIIGFFYLVRMTSDDECDEAY